MPTNVKLSDVPVGTLAPLRRRKADKEEWEELDRCERFLDRFHDRKYDYPAKEVTQSLVLRHVKVPRDADMYHRNYLEYLETCWGNHLGIVVTPDILWYTVLNELVGIVKKSPETYRHLFTDSDEKKLITVETAEMVVMPLNRLVGVLRSHVPTEATKFLPDFSTTTDAARHAMYASFCDLCSPYYSYGMLACAFPYIQVQGEVDDWARLVSQWEGLKPLFKAAGRWMDKVGETLANCRDNLDSSAWWRAMFKLKRCGSGSQTEVSGWFADLFRAQPRGLRYVQNFPTNVAQVEYRQLDFGLDYVMRDGMFFSRREGDFMVPEFGFLVHEKLKIEPEPVDPDAGYDAAREALERMKARVAQL